MANKEFISNYTLDLSLKSFMILVPGLQCTGTNFTQIIYHMLYYNTCSLLWSYVNSHDYFHSQLVQNIWWIFRFFFVFNPTGKLADLKSKLKKKQTNNQPLRKVFLLSNNFIHSKVFLGHIYTHPSFHPQFVHHCIICINCHKDYEIASNTQCENNMI